MVWTNASGRFRIALRSVSTPLIGVPSTSWPDASIFVPGVLAAPAADAVEILQRQTDRIHQLVASFAWLILHDAVSSGREPTSAQSVTPCPFVFSGSGGTFGGGEGGGLPSRFSRIHEPRVTGDVRFGAEVTVRKLPCPSRPLRVPSQR